MVRGQKRLNGSGTSVSEDSEVGLAGESFYGFSFDSQGTISIDCTSVCMKTKA
jgi:hypothetical protein